MSKKKGGKKEEVPKVDKFTKERIDSLENSMATLSRQIVEAEILKNSLMLRYSELRRQWIDEWTRIRTKFSLNPRKQYRINRKGEVIEVLTPSF